MTMGRGSSPWTHCYNLRTAWLYGAPPIQPCHSFKKICEWMNEWITNLVCHCGGIFSSQWTMKVLISRSSLYFLSFSNCLPVLYGQTVVLSVCRRLMLHPQSPDRRCNALQAHEKKKINANFLPVKRCAFKKKRWTFFFLIKPLPVLHAANQCKSVGMKWLLLLTWQAYRWATLNAHSITSIRTPVRRSVCVPVDLHWLPARRTWHLEPHIKRACSGVQSSAPVRMRSK